MVVFGTAWRGRLSWALFQRRELNMVGCGDVLSNNGCRASPPLYRDGVGVGAEDQDKENISSSPSSLSECLPRDQCILYSEVVKFSLPMMALSIFQSQLPKTLLLGTLILLSSLTITVCASPTPSSHFSKLTQTLILRNLFLDVGNSTNTLLTLIPKTYKLTLPWWTTTPGTVQDFLIAFWTVTFAWEKRGSGDKPAGKLKIVRKMYAIVSLFVQSVSGLVHLALNSRKFKFLQVMDTGVEGLGNLFGTRITVLESETVCPGVGHSQH